MKRVSLIAVLAAFCCLVLAPGPGSLATAASIQGSATYRGTPSFAARLARSAGASNLHAVSGAHAAQRRGRLIPFRSPAGSSPSTSAGRRLRAPEVSASVSTGAALSAAHPEPSVIHAFNGLSQLDSQNLLHQPLSPPDQGLCVGRDPSLSGDPEVVWEPVNVVARETTVHGTLLRPDVSLATLFQDPFVGADVRCLYDPSTQSFYFTEVGFPVATGPAPDFNNTTADVAVMNARGVATYQFDTSLGGPGAGDCFGDQPKVGFDNNALVISTDEFCNPTGSSFEGAIVLAISKPELVAEDANVSDSVLGPVSRAGRAPALSGHPGTAVRACRDGVHDHQRQHQPERRLHEAGLSRDHDGGRGSGTAPELLRRPSVRRRAPLG